MSQRNVQLDIKVTGTDQIIDTNKAIKTTTINAEKLADSTLKLTKGIAGGFELAAQAAGAFGEKNKQAFEQTIARATQYIALSNSLKDVAEGFTKANVKGLKDTVSGFLSAAKGARVFGVALSATGIGAILAAAGIALALIVANWESLVDWVKESFDYLAKFNPILAGIQYVVKSIEENFGSISNLISASAAALKGFFTIGTSGAKEFNQEIEKLKIADKVEDAAKEVEKLNGLYKSSADIINATIDRYNVLTKAEEQKGHVTISNAKAALDLTDDLNEKLIYQKQIDEELLRVQKYRAEEATNILNETESLRGELDKTFQLELDALNAKGKALNEEQNLLILRKDSAKTENEVIKDFLVLREKAAAFEIERNELIQKQANLTSVVRQLENEGIKLAELEYRIAGNRLITEKEILKNALEKAKISNEEYTRELERLRLIELSNYYYENQNKSLEQLKKTYEDIDYSQALANDKAFILIQLIGEQNKLIENQYKELNGIIKGWDDAEKAAQALANVDLSNLELPAEEVENLKINLNFWQKRRVAIEQAAEAEKEVFKTTGEKFAEEVDMIVAYTDLAASNIDQLYSTLIKNQQNQLQNLQTQFQLVDSQYTEIVNNQRSLEAELATAQGARRDEILASLEKERSAEKKLAQEKENLIKKQGDIQYKIQVQEWQNSVIQSAVLTAKAILNALNTVPPASFAFAAITAALAAVQTGIVAANKPNKPSYATGGFTPIGTSAPDSTGEKPVNAQLHEKEYVVPRWMVESDQYGGIVQQLEVARQNGKKSFAQGGFSTPVINDNTGSGTEALMAALSSLNLNVSVVEINDVQSRVNVIEQRASV